MPILESQLNGRIATLLGRMTPRWEVRGENKGAFAGSQRQPDILVVQPNAQPVIIENEYLPAHTVETEARERLGESLDPNVVNASGQVNAAIALRSPAALRDCTGLDHVDAILTGGVTLEYALVAGPGEDDFSRFPKAGFISGSITDLASFVVYAATPEDAVQMAVAILEQGVQDAAAILRQAAELSDATQSAIVEHLRQPYSDQTLRMAATIIVNALVFHQNLAGQHGVKSLDEMEKEDAVLTLGAVLREWRKILDVNYWSIFKIAGDLLGDNGALRPLIPMHTATAVTGTGEASAEPDAEDMPPKSQDLVIMNPPFTSGGSDYTQGNPAGYSKKQFHGLGTDSETQERMFKLAREYAKGTCAHGYAGIASWFVALANRMVKKGGTIALVLPMTALQGASWQKVRQLIADGYRDVTIMTIASARPHDQSFSADTGMAETMIVCRKSSGAPGGRGLFVSLQRRPASEMEATEIARAIQATVEDSALRTLEDGPFGGSPLFVGEERAGELIDAPLSRDEPWSAAGIADFSVTQAARQLVNGNVWLPQMREQDSEAIPMAVVQQVCEVGINHNNIVGNGSQAAFDLIKPPSGAPTYPMLWSHDAQREKWMVVAPDSEGRVKLSREDRAAEIWDTRSHAHYNADFRFNSQPLAVAFTEGRTIGGTAWKNLRFSDRASEVAYTLWGNSTLGLLCYWWHASRQQAGRGRMPITAIRSMPTLDGTKLTPAQLDAAESIFDDMRSAQFLPANEAYRDNARKELDHRVLIDMLGLPTSVLEPLDLLRLKWCSEPSVHGGKRTAPGAL